MNELRWAINLFNVLDFKYFCIKQIPNNVTKRERDDQILKVNGKLTTAIINTIADTERRTSINGKVDKKVDLNLSKLGEYINFIFLVSFSCVLSTLEMLFSIDFIRDNRGKCWWMCSSMLIKIFSVKRWGRVVRKLSL